MQPKSEQNYDIGIRCGYLLEMTTGTKPRTDYFLGIRGSQIAVVESWAQQHSKCAKFIDASQQVVLPGLINGHCHLSMTLFRGLADDLPFEDWLHKYILPTERKLVDEDFVRVGAELAALELIRYGTTTVCDSYFFEDTVGDVLDRSGLRGLISEGITDFPSPDTKGDKENAFRVVERMYEKFSKHERVIPGIAPHAPYSVSDETFKKCLDLSRKRGMPLQIHISETKFEVDQSLKQCGKTPAQRLNDLGVFSQFSILAHGVHLTPDDFKIIKASGASVIHNPESNMKLGSGVAPVPAMLRAGLKVGIGTDGAASNNNLNLFQEMDTAAKLQKLTAHDNSVISALEVLEMATRRGAEAVGLEDKIGTISIGKRADLIVVDLNEPNMWPVHDPISQLVYSACGAEVATTICHGKVLYENGEYKTLDRSRIYAEAEMWQKRIAQALSKG